MMRKKCWLLCMVALCLSLIATSCSKKESVSQGEITENFKALVMGGKDIDPNQTWNTGISTPITVSVNLEPGVTYPVYFFISNPAIDANAHYVGMAILKSGESKTVSVVRSANATQLYAACYGGKGKAICLPVKGSEVSFSGTITNEPSSPKPTTGNNWSVPVINMPSTSKYTTGTMVAPDDIDPESPSEAELHVLINNDYTGIIPSLNSHSNLSVYVTGTWTLTFDQRFVNGNVLVVGNGGKVVVPKGFKLSTSPLTDSQKPGMIYVLPGGEISGEGTVEFTDGTSTYSYNAGSITINEVRLSSGSLYNAGTIGDGNNTNTTVYGEATNGDTPGLLFNYGTAYLMQASGSEFGILNSNFVKVLVSLSLSSASRMDDGSTIECGLLSLQGDASSNSVLYMGNGSFLNCSGSVTINNYGVWGPSGNNFSDNALFAANGCSKCTTIEGNANTFMLDHVQLQLSSTFQGIDLISSWINGSGISADRQTCFFSMDYTEAPLYSGMFYAFEFPGDNSIRDFDYNDLVLLVSAPYDNGDGTYSCFLSVACVGTKLNIYLYYNGEQIGEEIHKHMSIDKETTVNTNKVEQLPRYIGELTFSSPNIDIGSFKFTIRTEDTDGSSSNNYSQLSTSNAPLFMAVNADSEAKWRWPREGTNIGLAYLMFSTWAANQQEATNWYEQSYAVSTQIVSW